MGGSCPLDRVASSRRRAARRRNGERKGLAPGEEDSYSVISLARQRGICPDMQNRLVPRYPLLCSIPRDACPIGLARRLRRAFFASVPTAPLAYPSRAACRNGWDLACLAMESSKWLGFTTCKLGVFLLLTQDFQFSINATLPASSTHRFPPCHLQTQ